MVDIRNITVGREHPFVLIAGPCVIGVEAYSAWNIASELRNITKRLKIPFIFKASYDKANRTSGTSYRGPGLDKGLKELQRIKSSLEIPVLSDVHQVSEVSRAAKVLDVIQIPALLCRQTDLVQAVARTRKPINIKKGQSMAPWDMWNVIQKVLDEGNNRIMITERGTMFGYNNLVVDFRSLNRMRQFGIPVIFDATHSVQSPGGQGTCSGGEREYIPIFARAAMAAGVDGIFMEVHPEPEKALCDGPCSIELSDVPMLLKQLIAIRKVVDNG